MFLRPRDQPAVPREAISFDPLDTAHIRQGLESELDMVRDAGEDDPVLLANTN